jgi:hypothetical protein
VSTAGEQRVITMNNEITQLLLLAIFFIAAIVVADWAIRPKDPDDDD